MKTPPLIRLRGIRQVVPSGYVMGRVSPGDGDAELIPISLFAAKQVGTGIVSPTLDAAAARVGWFFRGPIQAGKAYYGATSLDAITFPATGLTQYAYAETAPGLNYSLGIYLEGTGLIATVAWTSGVKTGTVTFSGTVALPALARLYVQNLTLADGQMRNATIVLNGAAP